MGFRPNYNAKKELEKMIAGSLEPLSPDHVREDGCRYMRGLSDATVAIEAAKVGLPVTPVTIGGLRRMVFGDLTVNSQGMVNQNTMRERVAKLEAEVDAILARLAKMEVGIE